ncbi:MAG: alcohol dehydrogenase catalytic domain-containing protein [Kiritimatiellae bacterium]|nr:alcohol dehydrogenase catalytic domain-containing protein [Kiritimatiellia bacterium]
MIERFGSIEVREVPEPLPGDYEALCELLYGATCTGTDLHMLDGKFPYAGPLPTVPGHESVGRVVKVGSKVRNFRVGDLVTRCGMPAMGGLSVTWGGYAEFGVARDHWAMCADGLPPEQWMGFRVNQIVPPSVNPKVAPMFTTWRETLSCMKRMGSLSGASVLVVGSGGNGLSFAAHAVNLGAASVVMVGATAMESTAGRLGVSAYVDYKAAEPAQSLSQVCPGGFEFAIDAVGRQGVSDWVLPNLKAGARYGTYGIDDMGKLTIDPFKARAEFIVHPCRYDEAETHQDVSEFVLRGKLNAGCWYDVDNPFPLSAIGEALAHVRARKAPKALISLHEEPHT